MAARNTYSKKEKLKSRKALNALFAQGSSFLLFPVKVFFMPAEKTTEVLQAGVGVSSRHFKRAVDRNRIKRLLRESYRLNKQPLLTSLGSQQKNINLFFLYIGKELPEYATLQDKMKQALTKLEETLVRKT